MKFLITLLVIICHTTLHGQNVGIGTTAPNAKAALEIKSTDKGVLFPRLTTAQRNAITNPPDGLHIFNINERCLNFYDSLNVIWNCYCPQCETVIINISMGDDMCNVDFYKKFAVYAPAKKYIINIPEDTYINGCNPGDTGLSFTNMPTGVSIVINNYGFIIGAGGSGGGGAFESGCIISPAQFGLPGKAGGSAISTKTGVLVTVNNYAIVAGGGGGGGGSTKNPTGQGGGGGGGAGIIAGAGGTGGGVYQSSGGPISGCVPTVTAQPGALGAATIGGLGGAGVAGGAAGGNGGGRGQPGQNGMGTFGAIGGLAGKAIVGGSGNIINNISGGQSFGIVD